ncbi:MAG: hypothetical protein ACOX61_08685 [Brooklawnia sp.]|jgi:hypothetical protein
MAKRSRSYRFEMPYQSEAPVLTDPDAGIDRLQLRGKHDRRVVTLTLFDTTDERLNWAGVMLAHQVVADQGHWLLQAPDWQPWLPVDRLIELDDGDELPADLAELMRPFRRRAMIGPVASVTHERAAYRLLDPGGIELGQLLDDRVTVRRGGVAVARHREVTFETTDEMSATQRTLVVDRLHLAGGTRVGSFPDPIERLASLTHPAQVPAEPPRPAELTAEEYLEWVFTSRLFRIWRADLQIRTGEVADTTLLSAELAELVGIVRGLEALLEPSWAQELLWHISQVDGLDDAYYEVLDMLAQAARAPRIGALIDQPHTAREILRGQATQAAAELVAAVDTLTAQSQDEDWSVALERAEGLARQLEAGAPVLGKLADRSRRITRLMGTLGAAVGPTHELDEQAVAQLSSAEAFAAGRQYERSIAQTARPRAKLLKSWPRTREILFTAWPRLGESVEQLALPPGSTDG